MLWEKENLQGCMYGFTENYLRVKTTHDQTRMNRIEKVALNITDDQGVYLV